jgi:hypothetical protein
LVQRERERKKEREIERDLVNQWGSAVLVVQW